MASTPSVRWRERARRPSLLVAPLCAALLLTGLTASPAEAGDPPPALDIEKFTNGLSGDYPNHPDVPVIEPGAEVTWTYRITNNTTTPIDGRDIVVSDSDPNVHPELVPSTDDKGDGVLDPGETWIYFATDVAQNLAAPRAGTTVVSGCDPDLSGDRRPTYENKGRVEAGSLTDWDTSHYCNPPGAGFAVVGNRVFEDRNSNGLQDAGEEGVPGVTVQLQRPDGTVVDTLVTNRLGFYLFTDVVPGEYTITFLPPAGAAFTAKDVGNNDHIDSDADPATGMTDIFDLLPGEADRTRDAGLLPSGTATIGDRVFDDLNRNGIQDNGEPGVAGVRVRLQLPDGTVVGTKWTGRLGFYLFRDIPPGDYTLTFRAPDGTTFTLQDQGADDTRDSDPDPSTGMTDVFSVPPGADDRTRDAGLVPEGLPTATVGDRVFDDLDRDGIQDNGEPGVPDVRVELRDAAGTLVGSATTNSIGNYLFTDVVPGDYTITFVAPSGREFTLKDAGTDDGLDSDADPGSGVTDTFSVAPGADDRTRDAGLIPEPLELATVGDRIFEDLNRNGIRNDGEPGVPGVTVQLQTPDGTVVRTTSANTNGFYLFRDVVPGDYTITFLIPAGREFTAKDQGSNDNRDSDADPATGMTDVFNLPPGADDRSRDAGLLPVVNPAISIEKYTLVPLPTMGGDLCDTLEKPVSLTFVYTGDSVAESSNSQGDKFEGSGDPNGASPVRIVVFKDGSTIYFDDLVALGESLVVSAAAGGEDKFSSTTEVEIYADGGALLQTLEIHTSCSAPLILGETFGALQLTSFTDEDGVTVSLPPQNELGADADSPTGPEAAVGSEVVWNYVVTNPGDIGLASVAVSDDAGTAGDTSDDFSPEPILEGGVNEGDTNGDGILDPGEEWRFRATGIVTLGQYANLGTVVGQPVADGTPIGGPVSDDDPSHHIGVFPPGDQCDAGKPTALTFIYTGDGPEATSHGQDDSKVDVTGDPNDASPVTVRFYKGDKVFFQGVVDLGGQFTASTASAGTDKFESESVVDIISGGTVLQSIRFHTSCSQPLALGDQFGAIQLVGFVPQQ